MSSRRFYALDIFRSICILVVTFYHVWETSFGQTKMIFSPGQNLFGFLTDFFLDYWGYSGIILPFISFFLIGFSQKKLNWQRIALIGVGLIGMLINLGFDPSDPSSWEWNLYGYLFFSIIFVQIIPNNRFVLFLAAIISLALLAVPTLYWQDYKVYLSEWAGQVLIGDLDENKTIGWGLLPWLAIPVLGYAIGRLLRQRPSESLVFKGLRWEVPVLLGLAVMLVFLFPMNSNISITNTGFYYYVFSGAPWFFWSRFMVILIWLRLSWIDSVNTYLAKSRFIRWLSGLSWNRHFGLCYFLQFAFVPLGFRWSYHFIENPRLMDLFWLFVLVATEFSTRVIIRLTKDLKIATSKSQVNS